MSYHTFKALFDLVPDDIILATGAADLNLADGNSCLCGTFMREAFARIRNSDPTTIRPEAGTALNSARQCMMVFGGNEDEWLDVYFGVNDIFGERCPQIEAAFVDRVLEAVERAA